MRAPMYAVLSQNPLGHVLIFGLFKLGLFKLGLFTLGLFTLGLFTLGLFKLGLFKLGFFATPVRQPSNKELSFSQPSKIATWKWSNKQTPLKLNRRPLHQCWQFLRYYCRSTLNSCTRTVLLIVIELMIDEILINQAGVTVEAKVAFWTSKLAPLVLLSGNITKDEEPIMTLKGVWSDTYAWMSSRVVYSAGYQVRWKMNIKWSRVRLLALVNK